MLKKDEYYELLWVPTHVKHLLTEGMVGFRVDKREFDGQIAMMFESVVNPRSQYGWFYIPKPCLRKINIDDSTVTELTTGGVIAMNNTNLQKMDGNYNVAIVKWLTNEGSLNQSSKAVAYACYDKRIDTGALVVCKTLHHGIQVGEVVSMQAKSDEPVYREIISIVEAADWQQRIEMRRQKAELVKQMQRRAEELKEISLYETLAKADPKMAELLREYNGMTQEVSTNEGKND